MIFTPGSFLIWKIFFLPGEMKCEEQLYFPTRQVLGSFALLTLSLLAVKYILIWLFSLLQYLTILGQKHSTDTSSILSRDFFSQIHKCIMYIFYLLNDHQ